MGSRQDLIDAGVVEFVKGFEHKRLFEITREEFDHVVKTTKHPLGRLDPDDERDRGAIRLVEDASTPWSFMQLFHEYLEKFGLQPGKNFENG